MRLTTLIACTALSITLAAPVATAQTSLADLEDEFDTLMDAVIEGGVPGALLRVENDEIALEFARGAADRRSGDPIRTDDLIRMGSVTKLFTATVVHTLVREGRLDLDTAAAGYLPAGRLDRIANGETVTLRQLLNHTGGVPDYYDWRTELLWDWRETRLTPDRVLDHIRGKPAANAPGEAYNYSNTGYHILALVAEAVTGEPMSALYAHYVFEPLGLEHTQYETLFTEHDRIHGYSNGLFGLRDRYDWVENTGPDGGMLGTAEEISTLLGALFDPDGALYETGEIMLSERVEASRSENYGLGASILIRRRTGEEYFGHTGGLDGYLTIAVYDPRRDVRIVLHINNEDEEALIAFYVGVLDILAGMPAASSEE